MEIKKYLIDKFDLVLRNCYTYVYYYFYVFFNYKRF